MKKAMECRVLSWGRQALMMGGIILGRMVVEGELKVVEV